MDRYSSYDVSVPDNVQKFAQRFAKVVREKNVYEILGMYTSEFEKISQRYYVATAWPKGEVLSQFIDVDDNFLLLYRELYFRHQFTYLDLPSSRDSIERLAFFMEESLDCWENYINLFNVLIKQGEGERLALDLPNQWLWDIVEMFTLQFQEWNSLRVKYQDAVHLHQKNMRVFREVVHDNSFDGRIEWPAVRQALDRSRVFLELSIHALEDRWADKDLDVKDYSWTEDKHIWSPVVILRYFHALASKGRVNVKFNFDVPFDEQKENHLSNISRMTAYFAILGLQRMHTLCGDYRSSLSVLESIDLSKRSPVLGINSCRISTHYYMAFSFLMTRRYSDAISVLEKVLVNNLRPPQRHPDDPRSPSEEILERMRPLLAIAYCLSPQHIDDTVLSHLQDVYKEDWHGLMNCDDKTHELFFKRCCPDFISLSQSMNSKPSSDVHPLAPGEQIFRHQLKFFLREISSRKRIPRIYKFMQLYTAISMEKFATFLSQTVAPGSKLGHDIPASKEDEDVDLSILSALVSTKLKSRERKWQRGSPAEGAWQNSRNLDFFADQKSIHIEESSSSAQCANVFLREIEKSEDYAQRADQLNV